MIYRVDCLGHVPYIGMNARPMENKDKPPLNQTTTTNRQVGTGGKRKKKVLILMSDTGGGHRASAQALEAAFDELFPNQVRCVVCGRVGLLGWLA